MFRFELSGGGAMGSDVWRAVGPVGPVGALPSRTALGWQSRVATLGCGARDYEIRW